MRTKSGGCRTPYMPKVYMYILIRSHSTIASSQCELKVGGCHSNVHSIRLSTFTKLADQSSRLVLVEFLNLAAPTHEITASTKIYPSRVTPNRNSSRC